MVQAAELGNRNHTPYRRRRDRARDRRILAQRQMCSRAQVVRDVVNSSADEDRKPYGHALIEAALKQVENQWSWRDEENEYRDRPVIETVVELVVVANPFLALSRSTNKECVSIGGSSAHRTEEDSINGQTTTPRASTGV